MLSRHRQTDSPANWREKKGLLFVQLLTNIPSLDYMNRKFREFREC